MSVLYEWVSDFHELSREIDYLEFNIDRNEKELKRWVEGDLQGIHLNKKSIGANLEETIAKQKKELKNKYNQMRQFIDIVDKFKGLENKILNLKYIQGMTLESIAEELNYSAGYIYKKHAQIMRMIKFAEEIT